MVLVLQPAPDPLLYAARFASCARATASAAAGAANATAIWPAARLAVVASTAAPLHALLHLGLTAGVAQRLKLVHTPVLALRDRLHLRLQVQQHRLPCLVLRVGLRHRPQAAQVAVRQQVRRLGGALADEWRRSCTAVAQACAKRGPPHRADARAAALLASGQEPTAAQAIGGAATRAAAARQACRHEASAVGAAGACPAAR
mmetsp:Transcript_23524/g.69895  ORF Transcript_23524/g.69895 Transcript_23524/m.69895 type:complete len:202 (-) Transcript_23524:621-1226(-)